MWRRISIWDLLHSLVQTSPNTLNPQFPYTQLVVQLVGGTQRLSILCHVGLPKVNQVKDSVLTDTGR